MISKRIVAAVTGLLALSFTIVDGGMAQADAGHNYHLGAIVGQHGYDESVSITWLSYLGSTRCCNIFNDKIGGTRTRSYRLYGGSAYLLSRFPSRDCRGWSNDYYDDVKPDQDKYWYIWA